MSTTAPKKQINPWREFARGIWKENPIFGLVLGMCPVLAVSTSLDNAIGMGLAATFVLICSNILVSLLKPVIPRRIRIPCFIVVIAAFVSVTDLLMHAFFFTTWQALGIFIPLIVVNCIILGRAEAYASRNKVWHSVLDALGMGLGFTLGLSVLAAIREILGNGSLAGVSLLGAEYQPTLIFILPPGAFIVLGLLLAMMNSLKNRKKGVQNNAGGCGSCAHDCGASE